MSKSNVWTGVLIVLSVVLCTIQFVGHLCAQDLNLLSAKDREAWSQARYFYWMDHSCSQFQIS